MGLNVLGLKNICRKRIGFLEICFFYDFHLKEYCKSFLFHCNFNNRDIVTNNYFPNDVCEDWSTYSYNIPSSNFKKEAIWNNSHVKVDNRVMYYDFGTWKSQFHELGTGRGNVQDRVLSICGMPFVSCVIYKAVVNPLTILPKAFVKWSRELVIDHNHRGKKIVQIPFSSLRAGEGGGLNNLFPISFSSSQVRYQ